MKINHCSTCEYQNECAYNDSSLFIQEDTYCPYWENRNSQLRQFQKDEGYIN